MDISLNYIEQGEGIPLILLHGNGESCDYFEHQLRYFCDRYRVIAVDSRGHGYSPRGTAPFTIAQFADDLSNFVESKNIDKAIILGFSDGANVAMKFALKYPDKVIALILNGGNLDTKGVKPGVQLSVELEYRLAKLLAAKNPKAGRKAELYGLMVNDPNIPVKALHKINAPTLVTAGSDDMIKDSHTRLIADNIKGAQLAIIEGDHFIAAKEPEAFNSVVESFLNGLNLTAQI